MVKRNTCIFISGNGSNLKNLLKRSRDNNFPIKIKLIVTDNKNAYGITYAKKNSIPYKIINTKLRNYEISLLQILKKNKISFICLAGYMKIVSSKLTKKYHNKIINIHPSLLPKYKGLNTHQRVLQSNEKYSGCTVHLVNSRLDSGKIILQSKIKIYKKDTPKSLATKILKEEHKLYPKAILKLFNL